MRTSRTGGTKLFQNVVDRFDQTGAASRIKRWQPRLAMLSAGPGTAKTSRFCSMACDAVESDSLRRVGSTPNTSHHGAGAIGFKIRSRATGSRIVSAGNCTTITASLSKLLLEETVNLAVRHAAIVPSLPNRCENLLERLGATLIRTIRVGGDHIMRGAEPDPGRVRRQDLRASALRRV